VSRSSYGPLIIGAGVALILVGLLVWAGAFRWFGRLPGDIRIERPGMRVYVPIASMLLISLLLSAAAAIVRRFR
jgi:hypothetical protein